MVISVPGFLLAITVHEFAHGYIAFRFGDPTARNQGRLTFNPLCHLDVVGTIMLVLAGIGWAKPVPVDPRYFRYPRQGMLWVSLAGPAANMATALVLAVFLHVLIFALSMGFLWPSSSFVVQPVFGMVYYGVQINVILAIFNLIPVPPLDGANILSGLLPLRVAREFDRLEPYGFLILIILIVSRAVDYLVWVPLKIIMRLLLL